VLTLSTISQKKKEAKKKSYNSWCIFKNSSFSNLKVYARGYWRLRKRQHHKHQRWQQLGEVFQGSKI